MLALTVGLLVFLLDRHARGGIGSRRRCRIQPASQRRSLARCACHLLRPSRRSDDVAARRPQERALAAFIALGIGIHNLGEGLVIGASFATGEAALASFLVVGFTLHNVTEGIGIAAPHDGAAAQPRALRGPRRTRRATGGARHLGRRVRLFAALGCAVLRQSAPARSCKS